MPCGPSMTAEPGTGAADGGPQPPTHKHRPSGYDGRQVHEAGAALDRVEGAEQGVQRIGIVRPPFEREQVLLHIRREVERLDDELLEHVIH